MKAAITEKRLTDGSSVYGVRVYDGEQYMDFDCVDGDRAFEFLNTLLCDIFNVESAGAEIVRIPA